MSNGKVSPVEILVIADRSGSMGSIAIEAINGFNTFLKEQQELPGEANLTLVLFDDRYEVPVQSVNVHDVEPLDASTFVPRGMTATYDAVGKTLAELLVRSPEKAIIMIITDGGENSSREYTADGVKELVKQAEAKGYEVLFLAQNLDAQEYAHSFGLQASSAINLVAGAQGMTEAYGAMSNVTRSYRAG